MDILLYRTWMYSSGRTKTRFACALIIVCIVTLCGCSSYHPVPLEPDSNNVSPDFAQIKILAQEIRHPVLKGIEFDYRNGLSPDEAAIMAVINNPKLKAARDKQQIVQAQLLQAGLLPNPELSYGMEFPVAGETEGTATAYGVGLNWDVSSLVTRHPKVDAAKNNVKSVNLDIAWQEWQVAETAKLHFYRLMLAERQLAAANDALNAQEQYRELIAKGFVLGEMTHKQLSDADSAAQESQREVTNIRRAQQKELLTLNQAIGLSPDQKITLQKDVNIPGSANLPSTDELLDGIADRRLDLLALKYGYESREAQVRAAIKAQFPRISLGPTGGRDIENVDTVGFDAAIDLPVFDRNQGNIAIERATRRQLYDEYFQRVSDAKFEIAQALSQIESDTQQIDAIKLYLPVLERLTQNYKKAAENGIVNFPDYYQMLFDLYSKQAELLKLQGSLVDELITLEIASGRYLPAEKSREKD
ncbi:MAG: TolC family protein [Sedimentisphaerales bacterium]